MPFKRCGYTIAEADIIQWAKTTTNAEAAGPWHYLPAIRKAFDAHPKDLKESFAEIFPTTTFNIFSIPSTVEPGQREGICFFVRAAGDSEDGTPEFKEWQWTEKPIDRKIKGILEEVLGLKLSDWFEKVY
ncbi:hypothetical protein H0H81_003592 [Sphagnurus paluster]|uniref:Uncharacterized protein n=1 Tax=Sphagnurus paluster TaxID=117069 RepID=A0A9P7FN54_9AGAR|nr:hypothetical protein H0H81_003592 [Sphagnurus paluster]